ncbi:MAG: HD domain-containing protein [bacterium]
MEVKQILDLMNGPSKEDEALVCKAYEFVADAHKDHKRFSGEPYLVHLVETAKSLAAIGMSAKTVAAGLLHDSIEDVNVSPETIEKEFGKEVRFLVEGVTKLGQFKYHGAERHRESLRKLLVATSKDARVLIIKLMDRLHNMRTLQFVPKEKRERIALETLEIYAAIAHRLGMGLVRKELEDLAFAYAYPEDYVKAKTLLTEATRQTNERLEKMSRMIKKELAKENITHFHTDYRVKGLWSLWQKLKRKGGDISDVYDVAALRVVVPDVADCYRTLGIVHNLWRPLPNKIKDYIAFPKPNGYQGLHTTVFSGDGGMVEIQIRTNEMHQEAQYGIAAHVMYKENEKNSKDTPGLVIGRGASSFDWVLSLVPSLRRGAQTIKNKIRSSGATQPELNRTTKKQARYGAPEAPEWLAELEDELDNSDFETTLRSDIFSHHVFAFTPKGDVVDLPVDSSPIDFAYAIHSDIGDHVFATKVNNKMVPLDTPLHNGDIVEIQTKKSSLPTQKWLGFAKTALARRHIRLALEKNKKS